MHRLVPFVSLALLAGCSSTMGSMGGGNSGASARAQFEVLRSLEGDWIGSGQHDGKDAAMEFSYHATANKSAVQETLFKGSDHEMVTMYHLDGDKLMLTHYCAAGNQPRMVAAPSADPHTMTFEFADATNMASKNDTHMHNGRIVVRDANHIEEWWQGYSQGKQEHEAHFELVRKKMIL